MAKICELRDAYAEGAVAGMDARRQEFLPERSEEFDKNRAVGRQKDSEARWTKKNNDVHYGWKTHVKADVKTKFILQGKTTAANVHESQIFEELVDDRDQVVLADSAYYKIAVRSTSFHGTPWCWALPPTV